MTTRLQPEFLFYEMTTISGQRVVTSLAYPDMMQWGGQASSMATRFSQAVQTHLLNEGEFLAAARLIRQEVLEPVEVAVVPPHALSQTSGEEAPRLHQGFATPAGTEPALGFVPALGVVAIAPSASLGSALQEAVTLEYRRRDRWKDARLQIAAQWFEEVVQVQQPVDWSFPSAQELRALQTASTHNLIHAACDPVDPPRWQVMDGVDTLLEGLQRAVEGDLGRSVLVVGEQGGGKSALIERYAADRRARGLSSLLETTAGRWLQSLTTQGAWQAELLRFCKELSQQDSLLVVGHLSELLEVGQYVGNATSLGEALREPMSRGQIRLIAEATPAEVALIERRSPGLLALWNRLTLPAMDDAALERVIVQAVATRSAARSMRIDPEVVKEIFAMQRRFSPYSGFPGKTIRFFDALMGHQAAEAGTSTLADAKRAAPATVLSRDQALGAFCAEVGMPRMMLDAAVPLVLEDLQTFFRQRLFGQDHVLHIATDVLTTIKAGLSRTGRPLASLLLIGPTGVGKTELTKAMTEFMFGDARQMIRLDMSEYAHPEAVLRLTGDAGQADEEGGAPDGILTGAVMRSPFSVVLFDEVEKAHPSFFDLLLQILGEGRLTAANGQTANFCGCLVVMTSNLGAQDQMRQPMGLLSTADDPTRHYQTVVQKTLRPELYNRIDHIVPFTALWGERRAPIFKRELVLLRQREGVLGRELALTVDDSAVQHLIDQQADRRYGARDVQRVIRHHVSIPLATTLASVPPVQPVAVTVQASASGLTMSRQLEPIPSHTIPMGLTEQVSQARRRWHKLLQGPLYIRMINMLTALMREEKQYEKLRRKTSTLSHWLDHPAAQQQRELQGLKKSAEQLYADIIDLEQAAFTAVLGDTSVVPSMGAWIGTMKATQKAIYHATRSDQNTCTLGLYAASPWLDEMLAQWMQLLQRIQCRHTARVIFLRDGKSKPPPTLKTKSPATEDAKDKHTEPSWYEQEAWPLPPGKSLPNTALIVGYELLCDSPGITDFLRLESGLWRRKHHDDREDAYVQVLVGHVNEHRAPPQVHRRHFYAQMKPHRLIEEGDVFNAEHLRCYGWGDTASWQHSLDQQFEQQLQTLFLGEQA